MNSFIIFTLFIALCPCQQPFFVELDSDGIEDYVSGFLISMKALEVCPNEFICFTKSPIMHEAFFEIDYRFRNKGLPDFFEFVDIIVQAFENAIPECESVH